MLNRESAPNSSTVSPRYIQLYSQESLSQPSSDNLYINDSEVITASNIFTVASNLQDGSINTTISNTSTNPSATLDISTVAGTINVSSQLDLNITSVDNDVNITSSDDLSLDSGNDIQFKIESSGTFDFIISNKSNTSMLELYEDSPNDVTNASLFNLRHNDYSSHNKTGELKLFVQDQVNTTFKTEDDKGTDANANLNFEVEGNTVFFDKDGNAESNKIMTIDGKTSLEQGLHLHKNLFLSFEVHSVDNNWDSNYTVPNINDKGVHLFNFTEMQIMIYMVKYQ